MPYTEPYFALLDDALAQRATYFSDYQNSVFLNADGIDTLDNALQQGWTKGWHSVLMVDYEWGLPLLNVPSAKSEGILAIHWFAQKEIIDNPEQWLAERSQNQTAWLGKIQKNINKNQYIESIKHIHEAIRRGDTYQINHTIRLHLNAYGNPLALYRQLRQPVPYAALCCLPDETQQTRWTLCFSPELFFQISADGIIASEPMKGTAPRLNDGQDEQRAKNLKNDVKNRAENVMIVDLLRNDLGKIAEIGSVRVPEPFKVSPFGSVWQMTSRVEAKLLPQTQFSDVLRATFPCGSITGAPKKMSMQIIDSLEQEKRDIYTGSIGFLTPCDSSVGFHGTFNVVIRTLQLTETQEKNVYSGIYGVGSGIVIDSDAENEWQECDWKARFLQQNAPFGVFETLRCENGECALLKRHLCRLQTASDALNLPLPTDFKEQIRNYLSQLGEGLFRVKIHLTAGGISIQHASFSDADLPKMQKVLLHNDLFANSDIQRRFKHDQRQHLDHIWQQAQQQNSFDALLFNQNNILLEGSRSNVFVKIAGEWHTPALDLDILNGIMRQEILAKPQRYLACERVTESHISREMLLKAEKIMLSNALRGVFAVDLIV
ncbi:MAG: bifunctional anthranilate synthase component I family protein/class IV aminotransferase [Neisseria sp.]|nr:bifunctional anthranilate synthase component I family protein/class IV aminotransferase [Neisseria sp.]